MGDMQLKLEGRAVDKAQLLNALALHEALKVVHCEHYFDTPDGRLVACGLTLAMCHEGGQWTQTLTALIGHAYGQLADRVEVAPGRLRDIPAIDLGRHRAKAARLALYKALEWHPSQPSPTLIEYFQLQRTRYTRDMGSGAGHLEISLDVGAMRGNSHRLPLCEVTLKLKSGQGLAYMFDLARRLAHEHRMCLTTMEPSWHGMTRAFPSSATNVVLADKVAFDPSTHDDQQLRAMVGHCLGHILPNASAVAAGQCDAEQVHQLRVGLRRLRTVLRELSVLADDLNTQWDVSLATAFRSLGRHRDRELMSKTLIPQILAAGAPDLATALTQSPRALSRTVRDPHFQSTLLDLLAFSLQQASPSRRAHSSRKLLEKRLDKLHHQVMVDGERFAELTKAQQHRVRKRLKRLRYLSEFASPLFDGGKVERYLDNLRPAQDALGEHNDLTMALNSWRRQRRIKAGEWFAVGWLTAKQEQTAQGCRKALRRIQRAKRFWS